MADFLTNLLNLGAQQSQPAPAPQGPSTAGVTPTSAGQVPASLAPIVAATQNSSAPPAAPASPVPTDEVQVTARKPNPPPIQYNNSSDVRALQTAEDRAPPVQGGGDNPGLWGLLPQNVQHGTLRNVLGALGDAFLIHAGHAPMYEQRMQNKEIGQAMAGYANNPQAAIERVAGTGAPGSIEMADKMEQNLQSLQIRKEIAEQNNQYRQSMIDSRNQAIIERMAPYVAGWGQSARTPQDYAAAYARADAAAKRVGPDFSAQDFGYIDPSQWTPGAMSGVGATTGQQMRTAVSKDSIAERAHAAAVAHGDRIRGQNISANRPTNAGMVQSAFDDVRTNGDNADPTNAAIVNRYLHGTRGGRTALHPTTVGGANPGGAQPLPPTAIQAYKSGTPQQRAAAKAAWQKQGFNVSGL